LRKQFKDEVLKPKVFLIMNTCIC